MRTKSWIFLAASLLVALAGAQSPVVLPDASYATTLGNANNNIPFSWQPTRYQQLFDGTDVGTPNLFRYMQLRPATGFGRPTFGGQMVELEVKLGLTAFNWNSATSDFATNNPNPTLVVPRTWVQMPVFRTEAPADWQVTIPFVQIWPWPAGGNNLCVEVVNWGNTNNNVLFTYPLDATSDPVLGRSCRLYASGNPTATTGTGPHANYGLVMRFGMVLTGNEGYFNNYGQGCPSSAGAMISGLKQVPRIGEALDYMLYGAPANVAALFNIGTSSGQWGPLMLPFDLGPAGAQGCWINASMSVTLPATVGGGGEATLPVAVPNDRLLLGVPIFTQWMVVDLGWNRLGLVTTTGGRSLFGL